MPSSLCRVLGSRRALSRVVPSLPQARRLAGALVAGVTVAGAATALAPAGAAQASSIGSRAVAIAAAQQGDPYVYGAAGPNAFDCSGLVRYVYLQLGVDLPHNSAAQYTVTRHVSPAAAEPGDIVFFYDSSGHIYHDGIYAGGGRMWVAPHTGTSVQLQSFAGRPYLVGRPYGSAGSSSSVGSGGSHRSGRSHRSAPVGYRVGGGHPILRIGAHGPAVVSAQRLLRVAADGEFGPMTRAATIRFQRAHHLLADGEVGPRTWSALAGARVVSAVYHASGHPLLRIGAHGAAVRTVQRAVRVHVDGDFGPMTQAAVKRFQARHGLLADGEVGPRTWAAIRVVLT